MLAAEPAGRGRSYLVAFGEDDDARWLVLDAAGAPVADRALVREVASIVVLCELAEELSGGGQLDELRTQLAQLRMTEQPPGSRRPRRRRSSSSASIGAPPRVASPAFLDDVGAATLALEQALGELDSPFASALRSSTGAMDGFLADVETRYKAPAQLSVDPHGRRRIRIQLRRRPGGPPAGPARVRGAAGRVGAGGPARAVRHADAEHGRRADRARRSRRSQVDRHARRAGDGMRDAMRVLFPEAVALVSAARQGFMRE